MCASKSTDKNSPSRRQGAGRMLTRFFRYGYLKLLNKHATRYVCCLGVSTSNHMQRSQGCLELEKAKSKPEPLRDAMSGGLLGSQGGSGGGGLQGSRGEMTFAEDLDDNITG